ncbi:RNA methyltransferase [Candidatus Marsarchaeota archaeon]|jgi:TrmH family RNA methyltransferase|nr:RNA methyltransferase [Candidatus Marsarchaeota archaeon]MCL5089666.1 RNA methyltransferase [Candidatus Marsarchaeota archaeon]
MPHIDIVVVEPIYQINIGYIARIGKNFGVDSIKLVNPKCKYNGKNAIKYSKHGVDLLNRARVYKTFDSAIKDSFAIGTTSIPHKANTSLYNIYTLEESAKLVKDNKIKNISIVLGRESTGLTKEEIGKCPANTFIKSNSNYNVLNISHALAIILYEFTKEDYSENKHLASSDEIKGITKLFKKMLVEKKNIRDKKKVSDAFEHILKRANATKKEVNALAIAINKTGKN